MELKVRLPGGSYPIHLGAGLLARAGALLDLNRRVLVVTDRGVPPLYAQTVARACAMPTLVTIDGGEGDKTLQTVERLLRAMAGAGFTRSDCVAAVGGGVVGDLAGFAAACYMRGIDFYNLPTTVLSMVDSSVGGKTGVNLDGLKNLVGAFHQPKAVVLDTDTLATLDPAQTASGLAEAVKMAACFDPALFARLEQPVLPPMEEIIAGALAIKIRVVEADEREQGLRRTLNFGHTIGHGIESLGLGLPHGHCVGLGMLPMCAPAALARLRPVLTRLGLPTSLRFDHGAAYRALLHDKKAGPEGIRAVLLEDIGCCRVQTLAPETLLARLENYPWEEAL